MKYLIALLFFLVSIICHSQSIERATVENKNMYQDRCFSFKKIKDTKTGKEIKKPSSEKNIKAIYIISYPENGCHYKKPKAIILEEGMTLDELNKLVKNKEKGLKYKLNKFNFLSKKYPYGLIYSKKCKNGQRKYLFGTYTTLEYTLKKCKEKNKQKGYKCEEVLSINKQ